MQKGLTDRQKKKERTGNILIRKSMFLKIKYRTLYILIL